VLGDSEETWFDVSLMHKDIRLALAAAREHRVPVPSAEVADKVLTRAADLGFVQRDIASIFEVLATDTSVASP
jgi:3-hydroxyisobutyrate dehydrogenase-like beta-hydroxyacid dehydrogenase